LRKKISYEFGDLRIIKKL